MTKPLPEIEPLTKPEETFIIYMVENGLDSALRELATRRGYDKKAEKERKWLREYAVQLLQEEFKSQ